MLQDFHIYYQGSSESDFIDTEWCYINQLVLFSSILHSHKWFGNCHLYSNDRFLKILVDIGFTKFYTTINTGVLESLDVSQPRLSRFWSFPKIWAINSISQNHREFIVHDLDLWYKSPILTQEVILDNDFIGYHFENLSANSRNPYIDPSVFLDTSGCYNFDWSQKPINCAVMYFANQNLIHKWVEISTKVVLESDLQRIDDLKQISSSEAVFIEQRLVSVIANAQNLRFKSLIENVYYPEVEMNSDGLEWTPRIGFTDDNFSDVRKIKHVWGLKKLYHDRNIRDLVIHECVESLNLNFGNQWVVDCPKSIITKLKSWIRSGQITDVDIPVH